MSRSLEDEENARKTRCRTSLDPLYRLPSEVTLYVLSFNKPSEIRFLSQASKDHRQFIVSHRRLQFHLGGKFSHFYYQSIMGRELTPFVHNEGGFSDTRNNHSMNPIFDIRQAILARGGVVAGLKFGDKEIEDVSLLGDIPSLMFHGCDNLV
jgi:hypothetical protein